MLSIGLESLDWIPMQSVSPVRRFAFFFALLCAALLFGYVFALTEQSPTQTTSLSTAAYERLTGTSGAAVVVMGMMPPVLKMPLQGEL